MPNAVGLNNQYLRQGLTAGTLDWTTPSDTTVQSVGLSGNTLQLAMSNGLTVSGDLMALTQTSLKERNGRHPHNALLRATSHLQRQRLG